MDNLDGDVAALLKSMGGGNKRRSIADDPPRNGAERVLQAYYRKWREMRALGRVSTAKPFVSFQRAGRLIKAAFDNGLSADELAAAVERGFDDEFVAKSGYTLTVILSASVLNRLLNAREGAQVSKSKDSVSVGWDRY